MANEASTSLYPEAEALQLPVHHVVGQSMAGRKLAFALGILLVALPILLIAVPWQQNVPGAGRVTALNPLNRIQLVPAPVKGRLVELKVREGSRVTVGQELAVMQDLDPALADRLGVKLEVSQQKLSAARDNLERVDDELISLQQEKDAALEGARADVLAAEAKVREADKKLLAELEEIEYLRENATRQTNLFAEGQASEKDYQKALADFRKKEETIEGAKAAIERAQSELTSKQASVQKVANSQQSKIDSTKAKRTKALAEIEDAKASVQDAEGSQAVQLNQVITAKLNGTVLRATGANFSDLINQGDAILEIVPDADQLAVEMWMRGIDAPLVQVGRTARMQFEGWPAVQFAGWPSVAVGTFGGVVAQVDAQAAADGRVRVMIVPDESDEDWPSERFLRQGVRASGWVQLETVSTGYEIWRQLNAFPPSIQTGPATDLTRDSKKGGNKDDKKKDDKKGDKKG